jgi:transcriptional regulator with GAF, ATPase, and Fis domain
MAPTLVALFGPKRGVRLDLEGAIVIGRASSAGLQLYDGKVSREHCRLLVDGGAVSIEDLGSQNGTFVNGEAVRGRRTLAAGDEIAVGDSLFVLDPDFAVIAARFGDTAVAVADELGDGGVAPLPVADDGGAAGVARIERLRELAAALAAAAATEAAVGALLAALQGALRAARALVLAGGGDGAPLRVLGGRGGDGGADRGADRMSVVPRATLAEAARRQRAVVAATEIDERSRGAGRSVVSRTARAVLAVPVMAAGHVRGFLYLERAAADAWTAADAALAEAVAAAAALHGMDGAFAPPPPPPDEKGDGAPVGDSPAFARAVKLGAAAARAGSTVLVTGETGTGKEELARFIHRRSGRGPFVALNCGAIPESLAEAELFGHERGAFTGAVAAREGRVEAADGGTLFLDEVAELPPALQVKLLRVLQERVFFRVGSTTPRSVDLRVVAATHRRLEAEVAAGRFREDLFYRLNVIRIELPPLRERRADIAPLARTLLARAAARVGCADPGLTPAGMEALARAPWPGNARELGNVLERALVLRDPGARGPLDEDEIADALPAPLPPPAAVPAAGAAPARAAAGDPALPDKVAALERAEIVAALQAARGVKARAAKQLGISRPTLDKKIADLGIDLWAGDRGAP